VHRLTLLRNDRMMVAAHRLHGNRNSQRIATEERHQMVKITAINFPAVCDIWVAWQSLAVLSNVRYSESDSN